MDGTCEHVVQLVQGNCHFCTSVEHVTNQTLVIAICCARGELIGHPLHQVLNDVVTCAPCNPFLHDRQLVIESRIDIAFCAELDGRGFILLSCKCSDKGTMLCQYSAHMFLVGSSRRVALRVFAPELFHEFPLLMNAPFETGVRWIVKLVLPSLRFHFEGVAQPVTAADS